MGSSVRVVSASPFVRAAVVAIAVFVMSAEQPAGANELDVLFDRLLRDPHNVELNLRYARLAEDEGEAGKALAAYERVLETEPGNQAAAAALRRLKVSLIPSITTGRVEIGGRYETNIRQQPRSRDRDDDVLGFAKLAVYDRRALLGQDWRSDVFGYADLHDEASEIDYWFARAHTGPTFELGEDATVQIAPGGSVSFLDGEWYYVEPAVRVTFENILAGLLSRLDIRGGYREINDSIGATEGYALDIIGRNLNRDVLTESDLLAIQPFFRWRDSDSQPAGVPVLLNTFVLGDYIEGGAQALYYIQPLDDLRLGASFLFYHRDYRQTIRLGTAERRDWYISPGAEVLIRNVGCDGCDIKADYRFEKNYSNDDTEDFVNHVVGVSGIKRF